MCYRNSDYDHNAYDCCRCYNKILTFRLTELTYRTLIWWTTGWKNCNTVCIQHCECWARPHSLCQPPVKCIKRHSRPGHDGSTYSVTLPVADRQQSLHFMTYFNCRKQRRVRGVVHPDTLLPRVAAAADYMVTQLTDCVTLCPLYSGCGRTLCLLCAAVKCRLTTRPCMQWNYPAMPKMLYLLDKNANHC